MQSIQTKTGWFLTFDRGEEFVDALRRFAEDHNLRGSHFTGLGAFEKATIAWWSWDSKEYEKHEIGEQVEVLSVTGDTAIYEGSIRVHAHVTLGRRDLSVIGGHLFSGVVRPTLELAIEDTGLELERKLDQASKLPLIVLPSS